MSFNLTDKAMLIKLSISQWTARKYDRNVSDKVASDYNADKDAGRYNKVLIAIEAIKKVQKIVNEARTFHYENTLPWSDDESRLLPATNYLDYSQKIREYKAEFESAVNDFIDQYPALVEEARNRLNGMFKSEDYPPVKELPKKYDFAVNINPLPSAGDFRVMLSDEEVKKIQADIEARTRSAETIALKDLWNRLYNVVKHMADRLTEKDTIFRDSLINNIVDLCGLLPKLNVLDDPDLEKMRREIELKLCGFNPDTLRKNETERETAGKSQSLFNQVFSVSEAMK